MSKILETKDAIITYKALTNLLLDFTFRGFIEHSV